MRLQDTDKYSCYEYTISIDDDHHEWLYVIHVNDGFQDEITCDEYYESREAAITAAENHIHRLENGPDDVDYDAPNYFEQTPDYWEQRRKLGE
jgi:hypothetical protein